MTMFKLKKCDSSLFKQKRELKLEDYYSEVAKAS